jgi:hypothetical protein
MRALILKRSKKRFLYTVMLYCMLLSFNTNAQGGQIQCQSLVNVSLTASGTVTITAGDLLEGALTDPPYTLSRSVFGCSDVGTTVAVKVTNSAGNSCWANVLTQNMIPFPCIIVPTTVYLDSDGDSYGDPLASMIVTAYTAGYVLNNTDCDDSNAAVKPSATEICNLWDDNCDGNYNEGLIVSSVFTDTGDHDWHNPLNWSDNHVPTVCHDVSIAGGSSPSIITSAAMARSVYITVGAELQISSSGILDIYFGNGTYKFENHGNFILGGMMNLH